MSEPTLQDVIDELDGPLPEVEEPADNHDQDPESESPDEESRSDEVQDNQVEDPTDDDAEAEQPDDAEEADKPEEPKEGDEAPADTEEEGAEEAEEEVEDEGEPEEPEKAEGPVPGSEEWWNEVVFEDDDGTPITRREARDGRLRQAEWTRRTQEAAKEREQREAEWKERQSLTSDLVNDESVREFLSEHPEAMEHLLQDPEAARALIGNPKAVADFWDDWEVIQKNPRLAERFAKDPEEASEVSQEQKLNDQRLVVAASLDAAIEEVSAQFADAGVDTKEVSKYVLGLGGIEPGKTDPDGMRRGLDRLTQIFVAFGDEGQPYIDTTLIRERFKALASASKAKPKDPEEEKAEEHNKRVDAELKKEPAPPKSPSGDGAAVPPEKGPEYEDLSEVINDLM